METYKIDGMWKFQPTIIWMTFNHPPQNEMVCRSLSTVLIIEHIQNPNDNRTGVTFVEPSREFEDEYLEGILREHIENEAEVDNTNAYNWFNFPRALLGQGPDAGSLVLV